MSTWKTILPICIGLLALGSMGCDDTGAGEDPDAGGGWTAGSNNTGGNCSVKPYYCEDLGDATESWKIGCCFDNRWFWCEHQSEGWELWSSDCVTCAPIDGGDKISCTSPETSGSGRSSGSSGPHTDPGPGF